MAYIMTEEDVNKQHDSLGGVNKWYISKQTTNTDEVLEEQLLKIIAEKVRDNIKPFEDWMFGD